MKRKRLKAYRRCAFCGCRDDHACLIRGVPCHWVGPRLCSNPGCIERAKAATRRLEREARGERAARGTPRPKRPPRYVTRDGREVHRSPWAWLAQRRKAWERDGRRCGWCGRPLELAQASVDHIRPRGMGGGFRDDSLGNLRTLCPDCHVARHAQRVAEVGLAGWLREREAAS